MMTITTLIHVNNLFEDKMLSSSAFFFNVKQRVKDPISWSCILLYDVKEKRKKFITSSLSVNVTIELIVKY